MHERYLGCFKDGMIQGKKKGRGKRRTEGGREDRGKKESKERKKEGWLKSNH